jgi:hypothetical protein
MNSPTQEVDATVSSRRARLVAAGSALAFAAGIAATPASAHLASYPNWDSIRAPENAAGVVFHPGNDSFDIYDNVRDGRAVWVKWNYVGIRDRWKTIVSRVHAGAYHRQLAEYPNEIYFRIYGHDPSGRLRKSPIVHFRTWGP